MESIINQRIKSVLEDRQISISAFSKMIGMQQVTCNRQIRGGQAVSLGLIEGFVEKFDDISAEWLLRGEGSMYRKEESAGGVEEAISTNMVAEPAPTYRAQPEQDESIWKAKYEAIKECYDMMVSSLGSMRKANVG